MANWCECQSNLKWSRGIREQILTFLYVNTNFMGGFIYVYMSYFLHISRNYFIRVSKTFISMLSIHLNMQKLLLLERNKDCLYKKITTQPVNTVVNISRSLIYLCPIHILCNSHIPNIFQCDNFIWNLFQPSILTPILTSKWEFLWKFSLGIFSFWDPYLWQNGQLNCSYL